MRRKIFLSLSNGIKIRKMNTQKSNKNKIWRSSEKKGMSSFNIYIVVYAFLVEVKWITFSFFFYLKNFSLLPSFFPAFIALIPFWVDTKANSGAVLWKKLFLEASQHWQENACVEALIKRDSSTIFFLWLLENLKEHLF